MVYSVAVEPDEELADTLAGRLADDDALVLGLLFQWSYLPKFRYDGEIIQHWLGHGEGRSFFGHYGGDRPVKRTKDVSMLRNFRFEVSTYSSSSRDVRSILAELRGMAVVCLEELCNLRLERLHFHSASWAIA